MTCRGDSSQVVKEACRYCLSLFNLSLASQFLSNKNRKKKSKKKKVEGGRRGEGGEKRLK